MCYAHESLSPNKPTCPWRRKKNSRKSQLPSPTVANRSFQFSSPLLPLQGRKERGGRLPGSSESRRTWSSKLHASFDLLLGTGQMGQEVDIWLPDCEERTPAAALLMQMRITGLLILTKLTSKKWMWASGKHKEDKMPGTQNSLALKPCIYFKFPSQHPETGYQGDQKSAEDELIKCVNNTLKS